MSLAVLAVCAGGVSTGVVAQQQQPQQLERVQVTGSNIKRIDTETVAPVEIITRDQIERTGQPTIADVLRTLPANSGGSFGESFSNSFAPGAAGISLRGLGQKTTLVLLNGRRVTGYGFAQNLQDSFVDLNSIPSSAVERVEILKDGASAIYGSDAIAGVVNIILRRDYKGVEVNVSGGSSEGKKDYGFSLTGGLGDLGSDRFNVFGVIDYFKRDELLLADTKFGADRDYRGEAGGRNFQGLATGGTWANGNNRRAITGCPTANVVNIAQAISLGLLDPASPLAQPAVAGNTWCTFDANKALSALPGTERIGFLGRGTYELSSTAELYAEVGLSRNKTDQTFTPPFFQSTGLTPTPAGLIPFGYNVNFAAGSAGNPFGSTSTFLGSLIDLGTRSSEITSDTIRTVIGSKFSASNWDFDTAFGYSRNEVESIGFNRLSKSGISAAFGVPSTAQPPRPTSTASLYNLDNPALNSEALRRSVLLDVSRKARSELMAADFKASTELSQLQLPGGAVGLAVGVDVRREELKDAPDPRALNGDILGQGTTATTGSRTSQALFGELSLPITKQLEGQLALRYDRYSDYGSSTTPKIGLKFTPNDVVALRANWGKGFRAPTLPEISPSQATFFVQVEDPNDQLLYNISGVFAGNPNLKAEKSTSTNLGIVFEPAKNFSISLDWYRINWENIVAAGDFDDILAASCPNPPLDPATGAPTGNPPCPSTPTVVRDATTNQVVTVFNNYQNLTQTVTSGWDLDMRWTIPTAGMGKFVVRTTGIYVHSFKEEGTEYAGTNGGSNTIPRIKAALTLDWDYGPLSLTTRANYTHGWYQEGLPLSFFNPATVGQTGAYPERTPSYTTFDLFGRYQFTKNLTVSAAIINLTDKTPPYDPGFSQTNLWDFSQFDVRGRQIRLSANLAFK